MDLLRRFLFCLTATLALFVFSKCAIDTCLPDRGSRVFSSFFRSPNHVCNRVVGIDASARRRLLIRGQSLDSFSFEQQIDVPQFVDSLRVTVFAPTVSMSQFPNNPSTALVIIFFLLGIACIATLIWQLIVLMGEFS